jgi:hypothetical protein
MNQPTAEPKIGPLRERRSLRAYLARHGTALLIALIMLGVTAAGGLLSEHLNRDQEQRMLDQRTTELSEFLSSTLGAVRSPLAAVGVVAAAQPDNPALLTQVASTTLTPGTTVIVMHQTPAGLHRIATLGADQQPPTQLADQQQQLAQRALSAADLVTGLVSDPASGHLLIALKVQATTPTVVVWDSPVQPAQPAPTAADSPYRDLNVAVYASATANPKTLLLISGQQPRSANRIERKVAIGSDTWLLVTGARQPLVGSFAAEAPLTITIAGILLSILIAVLVDVLTRRRAYAAELVHQRTTT